MQHKPVDMQFMTSAYDPSIIGKAHNKNNSHSLPPQFYKESSMNKVLQQQLKRLAKEKEIPKKLQQLAVQRKKRIKVENARKVSEKIESLFEEKIQIYSVMKLEENAAAIKIQKVVRGFLARIRFDDLVIERKTEEMKERNFDLERLTAECFLKLGSNTELVLNM
jgi:hypothetical protein